MVSKASDDLPEPDRPVMTVSVSRGISTSMFFRLCSRAPRTEIVCDAMRQSPFVQLVMPASDNDARSVRAMRRSIFKLVFLLSALFGITQGCNCPTQGVAPPPPGICAKGTQCDKGKAYRKGV